MLTADVRDGAAMQLAATHFIDRFGSPDVVIASAGVSHGTATERAEDLAAFAEIIYINVLGMVRTFQPFVAGMCASRCGALVGIASVARFRGLPGASGTAPRKPQRSAT